MGFGEEARSSVEYEDVDGYVYPEDVDRNQSFTGCISQLYMKLTLTNRSMIMCHSHIDLLTQLYKLKYFQRQNCVVQIRSSLE